ncbi:MAG: endonuclease/exonuclease/phosphatase family protein [Flavobacteriales bacterium]|nr:endonuclease/exonuclease/phosphatase family protein [Flavobacteriales bacterium]
MKKPFWANLIVLLIGMNSIGTLIGSPEAVNENKNTFSIMSYNVRLFNAYNWIKKDGVKNEIFDLFRKRNTDILCIQEFYAPKKLPKLDYPFQHIGLQNKKSQWHMAIYSKFPQINKGTVSIKGERMNNTCIFSDMIFKKDTFRVYNIHLASNWFDKSDLAFMENPEMSKEAIKNGVIGIAKRLKKSFQKRAMQVEVIKQHIEKSPYKIIVCGDFNDTPNSFAYHKISKGLQDSFLNKGNGFGSTFFSKIPFLRIDYILHSPDFKTNTFTTHKQKLSDHKAIESSLM